MPCIFWFSYPLFFYSIGTNQCVPRKINKLNVEKNLLLIRLYCRSRVPTIVNRSTHTARGFITQAYRYTFCVRARPRNINLSRSVWRRPRDIQKLLLSDKILLFYDLNCSQSFLRARTRKNDCTHNTALNIVTQCDYYSSLAQARFRLICSWRERDVDLKSFLKNIIIFGSRPTRGFILYIVLSTRTHWLQTVSKHPINNAYSRASTYFCIYYIRVPFIDAFTRTKVARLAGIVFGEWKLYFRRHQMFYSSYS